MIVNKRFKSLMFNFLAVSSLICFADETNQAEPVKEARFDYHDVVVDQDKHSANSCFANLYWQNILDIHLHSASLQVLWKRIQGEDVSIDSLARDLPHLKKYYDGLYECLEIRDKPNQETIALIKKLRANRVKIVLASNMHEDSLAHHKKSRKEIFDLFDILFVSGKSNGKKPDKKFYKRLHKKVNKEFCNNDEECIKNKQTIFVDDKKENVEGAQKFDPKIKGFVFKDPKAFEEYLKKEQFLPSEDPVGK